MVIINQMPPRNELLQTVSNASKALSQNEATVKAPCLLHLSVYRASSDFFFQSFACLVVITQLAVG